MADYFVSNAGTTTNAGDTISASWPNVEYAVESGALSAGDYVWRRRNETETYTSSIEPIYDGTAASPIVVLGVPRAVHTISSSDWTKGSSTVVVDDNDMSRLEHQSRQIEAPDGEFYFITQINTTASLTIDRNYAGTTTSNAVAEIQEDEDYDLFMTLDDTSWSSDSDVLPTIDFNDGDFQLSVDDDDHIHFKNFEFKDSTNNQGIVKSARSWGSFFQNCLFKQTTQNDPIFGVRQRTFCKLKFCTLEGSGSGSAQQGISGIFGDSASIHIQCCAIYNCGDYGFNVPGLHYFEDLNIGVEQANGDDDINMEAFASIKGKDVNLGGTNGEVQISAGDGKSWLSEVTIENYGKVLGENVCFFPGGSQEKVAVSGETPNKKLSDDVIKLTLNSNNFEFGFGQAVKIFEHEFINDTTSRTYKYYIYNNLSTTVNASTATEDIWLEAEYINAFDTTTTYNRTKKYSTETVIAQAADADDWDSLSVASVAPAATSTVRLTMYVSKYSALGNLYIDPEVEIS